MQAPIGIVGIVSPSDSQYHGCGVEAGTPLGGLPSKLCALAQRGVHRDMADTKPFRIAVLWRGNREARQAATPQNNRYHRIFEELAALGIDAEPAIYDEAFADAVREQLLAADGVLVWVDPLSGRKTRAALDAMLRDVASLGPWISAHPDVILKMGVKEVLHRTKHLGWGTDTHLYRTATDFDDAFPARLQSAGPRVLKQNGAMMARGFEMSNWFPGRPAGRALCAS